jgi:hypothetical protein
MILSALLFIALGLLSSFYAMIIVINSLSEKGVRCATGAVGIIPVGFLINLIGIIILIMAFRNKKGAATIKSTIS